MPVYVLVAFAPIGAVAGWIGDMLLKNRGLGLAGDILVGVVGGCVGGVLASMTMSVAGGTTSLIAATFGAGVLLVVLGLVRSMRSQNTS